ncbi:hypothetical protein C466_00295 [Halorubrum distributum JCM 10118]|uniref:Membrane-spanning protein n=2 Tax=Halorubrum distributum TaxID=29283 RepID=M0FIC2_9EURY|nr:hypothetical protein C466_00295 [Halorubrum distributum JCM 10118]
MIPDRSIPVFVKSRANTLLSLLFTLVLGGTAYTGFVTGRYESVLFSLVAIAIVIVPAVIARDPTVTPPWYFLLLICLPILWDVRTGSSLQLGVVPSLSLATLGLLLMVEIHYLTTLRLAPWFTIVLTGIFTLAMAAVLNIVRWISDTLFGTTFLLNGRTQDAINTAVMIEFVAAAIAGVIAGGIFYLHFQRPSVQTGSRLQADSATPGTKINAQSAVLSDRLGISPQRQRQAVRMMQAGLALVFGYGLWTVQVPLLINSGVALVITFVPAVIERDYGIPIEPALALWLTGAVFLHVLGTVGLYGLIPAWDSLTHTLSATVVAAAGYTFLRTIHLHASSIHFPPWAMFVFTLMVVLATGVVWEVLEFVLDRSALLFGADPVLAQHGIDDTIIDLIFNGIGSILVAMWGTVYLTTVSKRLASQLTQ